MSRIKDLLPEPCFQVISDWDDAQTRTAKSMHNLAVNAMHNHSLSCCENAQPQANTACVPKPRKKEMYMEVNTDGRSDLAVTRSFLRSRLDDAKEAKREPTKRAFGMADDEAPRTANELIERIKAGKYTIDEDRGDSKCYGATHYLNWRDPSVKKDEKGYSEAWQKVRDAKDAAEVIIMTGDALEGRKALTDFQES